MPYDDFWEQTPKTFSLHIKAAEMRQMREHNARVTQAYYTAALSRSQKRLPRLESLFAKPKARRRQTVNEQIEACRVWAIASGGEVRKLANGS